MALDPRTNPLNFGSDLDPDPDMMTLYPGFSALAGKVFVVDSSGCHQCVPCRKPDVSGMLAVTSLAAAAC